MNTDHHADAAELLFRVIHQRIVFFHGEICAVGVELGNHALQRALNKIVVTHFLLIHIMPTHLLQHARKFFHLAVHVLSTGSLGAVEKIARTHVEVQGEYGN